MGLRLKQSLAPALRHDEVAGALPADPFRLGLTLRNAMILEELNCVSGYPYGLQGDKCTFIGTFVT